MGPSGSALCQTQALACMAPPVWPAHRKAKQQGRPMRWCAQGHGSPPRGFCGDSPGRSTSLWPPAGHLMTATGVSGEPGRARGTKVLRGIPSPMRDHRARGRQGITDQVCKQPQGPDFRGSRMLVHSPRIAPTGFGRAAPTTARGQRGSEVHAAARAMGGVRAVRSLLLSRGGELHSRNTTAATGRALRRRGTGQCFCFASEPGTGAQSGALPPHPAPLCCLGHTNPASL